MKRLIFIILLSLGASVYAQDIITLRNGNEIRARVTEISATEIRYLRFDHLDGPTRVVPRIDVFFINYEDGTREIITPLYYEAVVREDITYQTPEPYIQPSTILPNFCNTNTPGWGKSLGVVSFQTNREWTISGSGITQIWSDAVTATSCQKVNFNGGGNENFNADCRSNPGLSGDLFSWCAVARFANQLCPYPWRVPTHNDFRDLDIALGGTGNNRTATPQFVANNYINSWGGAFGGGCSSNGTLFGQNLWSRYWSQTDGTIAGAFNLGFDANGVVFTQGKWLKVNGLALRCVR